MPPRKSIKRLPLWARNSAKPFYRSKLCYISMASAFSLALILSLVLFFTLSSASRQRSTHSPSVSTSHAVGLPAAARDACKVSVNPPACEAALAATGRVPTNPTAVQIIQSAMRVSSENLKQAESMVKSILAESSGNKNRSDAAKRCLELYGYVERRMESVGGALTSGKIKDARAWMSAVLVYHYDCWSALKYVNNTARVNSTMAFTNSLIGLTSNALAMLVNYDRNGKQTGSWGPVKTERNGFWEGTGSSGSGINGGVPAGLKPDVTVCPDGKSCKYKKIQDAVNAAPNFSRNRKFVILIKAGVYVEIVRVPFEKTNVVFLGEGMGKTVITGSLNAGMLGVSTYNSATVGVVGDGFMASGVTFKNTAGAHQAVAFRSDSDLSIVENCEFLGDQDTLYAHSLRQYYKSCRIQGNVDFIFGNSASFFQGCTILVAPRQVNPEKGENNAVTAHGRIDPGQSTGFVFQNCVINGTAGYMRLYFSKPKVHKNYLGRPWKEYSRTVFIKCTLEALISPNGWMPWTGDFALKTLYYGEFQNIGAGATTSGRVNWSSQIPAKHVSSYSIDNFIQGGQWIPTSS
ncbi:PREDICTED: probable pectinesterase/pectinesterase inhibitor 51 [Ipomoea nil]|uniref:probable pectinesterase/pectinesterase inhibitor 51 n=1 Tax=Ipomoea nil TaxID=35883 RepID=UPI0009014EBB|nr:PREDICTED: probable pectinesterase/pectinesterase inhibitor 51 [Ipomoea nil]